MGVVRNANTNIMAKKIPDFKETTSLQQFRGAIDFLQTHIQLLDASLIFASKEIGKYPDKNEYIHKILNLNQDDYAKLNHPARQHKSIISHSKKKNIEFAIIRLFNLFTTYLQGITSEMYHKAPMMVVGKAVVNKNGDDKENLFFTYADIVRLQNYKNVEDAMIKNIFRSIEDLRSTPKLLEKILKDTKVNIPNAIQDNALMYLEMRHLFIHNNGIVDNKFANKFGKKFTPELKDKSKLPTTFETFTEALTAINDLVCLIDKEMLKHNVVEKRKFKP